MRQMEEKKRKAISRRMMKKKRKRNEKNLDLEEIFKFALTWSSSWNAHGVQGCSPGERLVLGYKGTFLT